MIPIPLNKIGLSWRDHKSALWWLGLLYRRPAKFRESLTKLPGRKVVRSGFLLWFHSLPYIIALNIIGRLFIFGWLKFHTENHSSSLIVFHTTQLVSGICLGIILGISLGLILRITRDIAFGIACGIAFGIAGGVAGGIAEGIAIGIARGIVGGIALGVASGVAVGITEGVAVGIRRGIALAIAGGIAVGAVIGIAAGIAVGIAFGIFGGASFLFFIFRLYYYPYHLALTWTKPTSRKYCLHPVAWDDLCPIPFIGLHNLLVNYADKNGGEGVDEIERLINNYPSQQMQAWFAKVVLLARVYGNSGDLIQLKELVAQLPEGKKGFLAQTAQVRKLVSEIIKAQDLVNTINRPIFQEPTAQLLCSRIDNFRHSVARLHKVLAREFHTAANRWFEIAERQLVKAQNITNKEATPQIFSAGLPVNRDHEAFVVRNSVVGELEQQIMSSTACPGLVLFGRRRVGKSSILNNLTDFLPTTVTPVVASMQRPEMFTSVASLTGFVSRELRAQLDGAGGGDVEVTDLTGFFQYLKTVNDRLEASDKRLLLAIDEYETIDKKIGEGVFPLNLLDTIRESIQSHRRITWIFAGSHEIYELKNAAWTSY
ncbi:MAG: AAA family ATPase, partial [Blastocatellia bacterium]